MALQILAAGASGAVIILLVLAAALALRDARDLPEGRALAALALCIACLELASGPLGQALPRPIWFAVRLVVGLNLCLLWLLCMIILRDPPRPWPTWGIVAGVLCIGPLATMWPWPNTPAFKLFGFAVAAAPYAMLGHILYVALADWRSDLVESRLKARMWLPLALAAAAFVSVASEQLTDPALAAVVRTAGAGLPAAFGLLLWLTGTKRNRLQFEAQRTPAIDPRDHVLLDKLNTVMANGLYREPGLSLDVLAQKLNTPPHRLRALINQGLGHRNFAAFVNRYRLEDAKAALRDPTRGRETVLAIAFEAGFASLQTFNRVFKDEVGDTPTAFRESALAKTAQN
jgi:AraC-like DNA-binding protein